MVIITPALDSATAGTQRMYRNLCSYAIDGLLISLSNIHFLIFLIKEWYAKGLHIVFVDKVITTIL